MILRFGSLLAPEDQQLGHGLLAGYLGVNSTPSLATASGNAAPQIMFDDGMWHRVLLGLLVDNSNKKP